MKYWLPQRIYPLISAVYIWIPPPPFWDIETPLKITYTLFYYFEVQSWLPMTYINVVGYDNGVQLFKRKAIIELSRANDHSATALLSIHIQQ